MDFLSGASRYCSGLCFTGDCSQCLACALACSSNENVCYLGDLGFQHAVFAKVGISDTH